MRSTQFDELFSDIEENNDLNTIIGKKLKLLENREWAKSLACSLTIAVVAVFILLRVFFGIAIIRGTSMVPAYRDGDIVLFTRILNEYQTGDVIFVGTENARKDYFKRIVGLPGQTVDINDTGAVLIDGEPLAESYIYERTEITNNVQYPVILGLNECFIMGDNRTNSRDSREFGPIDMAQIDGKVFFMIRIFH